MNKIKKMVKYAGVLLMIFMLTACSAGISQEKYDSVVNEKNALVVFVFKALPKGIEIRLDDIGISRLRRHDLPAFAAE